MLHRLVEGSTAKLQNPQILRSILPAQPSPAQYHTDLQQRVLTPEAQAAHYMTAEEIERGDEHCHPLNFYNIAPRQQFRALPTASLASYNTVYARLVQLTTPEDETQRVPEWTSVLAHRFPFDNTTYHNTTFLFGIHRPRCSVVPRHTCDYRGH